MIPPPIVKVVDASRAVVRARKELDAARKSGELNERGIKRLSEKLRAEVKRMVAAVDALEALIKQSARNRPSAKNIPWASIFNAASGFVGLVAKAKAGDPAVMGDAARWAAEHGPGDWSGTRPDKKSKNDVIDGEFEEVE